MAFRSTAVVLGMALALFGAPVAHAQDIEGELPCYDTRVYGRIGRQLPTAFPDLAPEYIVFSWPWLVELEVERVIKGRAPLGTVTILAVLHTPYAYDFGRQRWWLRRNTLGTFNLLRYDDDADLPRCPPGTPRAKPYLQPEPGQSLRDLIRETEKLRIE